MENEFQFQKPLRFGGKATAASIDEAYFSGICAGLSFRSLLAGGSFEPPAESRDLLGSPITESPYPTGDGAAAETPLYNFFAESAPSPLHHHQLPNLLSFELPKNAISVDSPAPSPRFEADPHGKQGRPPRRRQPCKLSDKTSCLRKLLPGDGKMDMATVLEEAYKYIKFLQAQVSALQSMPCHSASAGSGAATNAGGGDLPNLNRQQLLQVVTNSPAVQAQLCAEGCCVYSAEQLILAEKIAERKAMVDQQVMYGSPNPSFYRA